METTHFIVLENKDSGKHKKLRDYIDEMEFEHVFKMSPTNVCKVTDGFKENLFRLLLTKADTNEGQRELMKKLKHDYELSYKEVTGGSFGFVSGYDTYPDYFGDIELTLECNRLITEDGSVSVKKAQQAPVESAPSIIAQNNNIAVESQMEITALQQKIKEQESTIADMKVEIAQLKENNKLEQSNVTGITVDEIVVELLLSIFYGNEQNVKQFLQLIKDRPETEITDVVHEWVEQKKISEKSKGRPLWRVLHAAKLYGATEQNWNTALRMHP